MNATYPPTRKYPNGRVDCVCGAKGVYLRQDGTMAKHRTPYRDRRRVVCDGRPDQFRAVTLTLSLVVPADWPSTRLNRWAETFVRRHVEDSVTVEKAEVTE